MTNLGISPINVIMPETLNHTDNLTIKNNVLTASGTNGGFIDEFEGPTIDTSIWEVVNNASVSNGKLVFSGGTGRVDQNIVSRKIDATQKTDTFLAYLKVPRQTDVERDIRFYSFYQQSYYEYADNIVGLIQYTSGSIYFYARGGKDLPIAAADVPETDYIYIVMSGASDGVSDNKYVKMGYSFDDMKTVSLLTGITPFQPYLVVDAGETGIETYAEMCVCLGYPTTATATLPEVEAYTAELPAKLAYLISLIPNFSEVGNGGAINFLIQRKSDWDDEWTDLSGQLGEWTDLGVLQNDVAIYLPEYFTGPNEKFRYMLVYSGDGLSSYGSLASFTFAWLSNISSPDSPTLTSTIVANENIALVQFSGVPDDAHAIILDVKKNDEIAKPLSCRNKLEEDNGHLRLVGPQDTDEKANERNSLLVAIPGFVAGDTVQATAYAIDNQENQSAGVVGDTVIMQSANYVPVAVENIELLLSEQDGLILEVE